VGGQGKSKMACKQRPGSSEGRGHLYDKTYSNSELILGGHWYGGQF
jgi:hypothetical protein